MGDFTVRFKFDTSTGRKEIVVEYESDSDALPVEHEKRHRQIVEKLLGEGIIKPDETGNVRVERVKPISKPSDPVTTPPQREPVKS